MGNIIEASELPEGEKIWMKRDIFGWRVVQPIKIDGKIQWLNLVLGGKRNALFLLFILLIAGFVLWSYHHDVKAIQDNYGKIAADPIGWCKEVNNNPSAYRSDTLGINWSSIKPLEEG